MGTHQIVVAALEIPEKVDSPSTSHGIARNDGGHFTLREMIEAVKSELSVQVSAARPGAQVVADSRTAALQLRSAPGRVRVVSGATADPVSGQQCLIPIAEKSTADRGGSAVAPRSFTVHGTQRDHLTSFQPARRLEFFVVDPAAVHLRPQSVE